MSKTPGAGNVFLDALASEWHLTKVQPTHARQSVAEPSGAP